MTGVSGVSLWQDSLQQLERRGGGVLWLGTASLAVRRPTVLSNMGILKPCMAAAAHTTHTTTSGPEGSGNGRRFGSAPPDTGEQGSQLGTCSARLSAVATPRHALTSKLVGTRPNLAQAATSLLAAQQPRWCDSCRPRLCSHAIWFENARCTLAPSATESRPPEAPLAFFPWHRASRLAQAHPGCMPR